MKGCPFCKQGKNPEFRDYEMLRQYVTFRGKIVPREKSHVCAKHQRKLATAIKQARVLALMPYVVYES